MSSWSAVCLIVAALALVQAVLTLQMNPRASLNRAVALMAVNYGVWVFCHGLTLDASAEAFDLAVKVTSTARVFCVVTPLAVVLLMVKVQGKRFWGYLALPLAIALVEAYQCWTGLWIISGYHQGPWGRVLEETTGSFWATFQPIEHQLILVLEVVLLVRYWRQSRSRRERRILEQFLAAGLISDLAVVLLASWWRAGGLPDLSPVGWFLIVIVYYILVVRYKHLMDDEPELAGLVFRFLNVRSLLANDEGKVAFVSQEMLADLERTEKQVWGQSVFDLLPGWPDLPGRWDEVRRSRQQLQGLGGVIAGRRYTLNLVPHRNDFDDLDGILVLAEPVWDFDAVVRRFGISPREREVGELLVKGKTINEIADQLCISMATVKNHIHKLLQKTRARNRVELVRLLTAAESLVTDYRLS